MLDSSLMVFTEESEELSSKQQGLCDENSLYQAVKCGHIKWDPENLYTFTTTKFWPYCPFWILYPN